MSKGAVAGIGLEEGIPEDKVETEAQERFLTLPRLAGIGLFLLFALSLDVTEVQDDGAVYYDFLRKLFGANVDAAAYQFGGSIWNAPFYLASQLVALVGDYDRYHSGAVGVVIASNAAVVAALYLGWRILRELDLPRGPGVLLLTVFGTPLYFYAVLRPSYKHAADTLYATAAVFFLLRSLRPSARRLDFVAAGVCFGLLLVTRYANVALLVGVIATLVATRYVRAATWMLGAAVLTSAILLTIPVVRHIPYKTPPELVGLAGVDDRPVLLARPGSRLALGGVVIIEPVLRHAEFKPLVPFYMLFTLHRGIFLWTPLTAFATIGFVLLLRRDRGHRAFLAAVGASSLALLAIHVLWGAQWDGGGSFSQRFLTALFPFFLIGAAEFVRRTHAIGIGVLAICAAFSVWIGLIQTIGYYQESGRDSVVDIVETFTGPFRDAPPHNYVDQFQRNLRHRITDRWQLYWRLVT
jgi:hypothetical protein